MEIETLFTYPKWKIFQELSKSPQSPQQLAQKLKTSMANVSQQLKILEAMQLVKRETVPNNSKGKPKALYYLKEDFAYLIFCTDQTSNKQTISFTPSNEFFLNSLVHLKQSDHDILQKFFWTHCENISKCAVSLIKHDDTKIELLIVSENLEQIRKIHNPEINLAGHKKKIVIWSHNDTEMKNGIASKESHFITLINEARPLLDRHKHIKKYKEELLKIEK